MKLAFADAHRYVADPDDADVPVASLLDRDVPAPRARASTEARAGLGLGEPPQGGTVYLSAADADGMMVSYIQSNYKGFGSGVVVPGTGITLQNRGHGFTLAPVTPTVAPGKRPYHTIIPGFPHGERRAVRPLRADGRRHAAAGPRPAHGATRWTTA